MARDIETWRHTRWREKGFLPYVECLRIGAVPCTYFFVCLSVVTESLLLCRIDPPWDLSFGWTQIEAVIVLCFCFQVDQPATTQVFKYEWIRSATPH